MRAVELRFKSARTGQIRADIGNPARMQVRAARRSDGLVFDPRFDHLVGQFVQVLEIGIAQHKAIVGIPKDERLRDGFDGVAQPQVRGHGALN